jgi:hypothetical protein
MLDLHAFKSLVHWYASRETSITPLQWERIVSLSFGGKHIGGDIYMADGVAGTTGLNIKSITTSAPKRTGTFNREFIQCRVPLENEESLTDEEIGKLVIDTLNRKRDESLNDLGLDKMLDVVVLHKRKGDQYSVSLFAYDHPDYGSYDLTWKDGVARTNSGDWMLKRNAGWATHGQSCLRVRKPYDLVEALASFTITCPEPGEVSVEEAIKAFDLADPVCNDVP